MINYIDVLSPQEAAKARETLTTLKADWIDRGQFPDLGMFFTLGAASYMDVSGTTAENYIARKQKCNPILEGHFGWLYSSVRHALEGVLGGKAYFDPALALPGFHIWLAPSIFVKPNASIHFDLQHRYLRWDDRDRADFAKVFSFTLPICLPRAGGGLNTWDISHEESESMFILGKITTVEDLTFLRPKIVFPYSVGTLAMHWGTKLHQIAPVDRVESSDARITLQGHGVWCNDQWLLYW